MIETLQCVRLLKGCLIEESTRIININHKPLYIIINGNTISK